jgi:protein TonB
LYQQTVKTEQPAQNQVQQQDRYVPAYTTSAPANPVIAAPKVNPTPVKEPQPTSQKMEQPTKETPKPEREHRDRSVVLKPKKSSSLLFASFNQLHEQQMREIAPESEEEPMYLIGDDSMPANPFIQLLGRSLSRHFRYPDTAARFGIRGKAVLEFTLQLDGTYSQIRVLRSSGDHDLDAAALYAVNMAPTIPEVTRFISKPKHFIIGFVFR